MLAPNLIGFEKIPQTIPHFSLESFRKKIFKHAEDAIRSVEQLERLIFFDADVGAEQDSRAVSIADIENSGAEYQRADSGAFEKRLAGIGPEDLATIIYTSGTTGEPK